MNPVNPVNLVNPVNPVNPKILYTGVFLLINTPPLVIQNLVNLLWLFIREISGSEFRPGHLLGQQPQNFIRKIPHKNTNSQNFRAARAEFAPVIY